MQQSDIYAIIKYIFIQEDSILNTIADDKTSTTRNLGIDLLKILCMIMIPVLHVLGQGGVLRNTQFLSVRYELGWALEILCFCAVNCYAILSGYVNFGRKFRYSKILELYLQVLFYTVGITVIFKILHPEYVSRKMMIQALFPFAYNEIYWYYTSYFCMCLFIPFMNRMVEEWDQKTVKQLLFSLFLILSLLPVIFLTDIAKTISGYSVLWLSALYLLGAYMRKYDIPQKVLPWKAVLTFILCTCLTWLAKLAAELVTNRLYGAPSHGDFYVNYTAPFVLFSAISLVCVFARLQIKKPMQKIIRFFAPVSFGVYLLHVEPLIWEHVLNNAFTGFTQYHPVIMCVAVIGAALGIWLTGSLVDWIRLLLFSTIRRCVQKH